MVKTALVFIFGGFFLAKAASEEKILALFPNDSTALILGLGLVIWGFYWAKKDKHLKPLFR